MFFWFTPFLFFLGVLAAVVGLVMGVLRRKPGDLVFGAVLLLWLALLFQLVLAIIAPWAGNQPRGDIVEFYLYLVTAVVIPPVAGGYVFFDRTVWGNLIFAFIAVALLVMVYRMQVIWG